MTKLTATIAAVCIAWTGTLLGAVTVRAASPVETVLVLTPVVHGYEISEGALDGLSKADAIGHGGELARASQVATAVQGLWPVRATPSGQAWSLLHGLPALRSATEVVVERYHGVGPATTEIDRPETLGVYVNAPHTHAGLVAWLGTLRWPWGPIGTCESVHDDSWRESSDSYARGIFQFLPSTWASLGLTGDPAAASWRDQLRAAIRLRARDGLRQSWVCARILGIA